MKPYEPLPGSIPARVVAHLKSLPAGTEIGSGALADAVGQDVSAMIPALIAAVKHGVVASRKEPNSRFLLWSLGDGTPPAGRYPVEPDEESAPAQITTAWPPAAAPKPVAPPPPAAAPPKARLPRKSRAKPKAKPSAPAKAAKPAAPPAVKPARPEGKGMRIALWSDGQLQIHRGNDLVQFSLEETRQLLHYLDRLAEARTPG